MGKKLIIPGADFSDCSINEDDILYPVPLYQGAVGLFYGQDNFGAMLSPSSTRLHSPSSVPVFIKNGATIFFKGLKSLDETKCLLIDGVQYSQQEVSHAYAEHSLNGDSPTSPFVLNSERKNEYSWTNNLGDGYFIFCFADGADYHTAANVSPNEFELLCSIDLS